MNLADRNRDPRVGKALRHALELDQKGEIAAAVDELSGLLEELPRVAILHAYLAEFLSRCGRFEEAVKHGREAARLAPTLEMASLVYYQALWSAGRGAEAFEEMNRFLNVRHSQRYASILWEWDLGEPEGPVSGDN